MSPALDGRLPSGKRASLLDHIADCEDCACEWERLRRAQDLIFILPGMRVSKAFHEGLHDRIRSGEGAPEAVFADPVPGATKLRYLATGAAAAAAVLLAFHLYSADLGDHPDRVLPSAHLPSSAAADAVIAELPGMRGSRPGTNGFSGWQPMVPVDPAIFASRGAETFAQSARTLQSELRNIVKSPSGQARSSILGTARQLRVAADALSFLQRRGHIEVRPEVAADLRLARRSAKLLLDRKQDPRFGDALELLQRLHLDVRYGIRCCADQRAFVKEMQEFCGREPDAFKVFRVFVTPDSAGEGNGPVRGNGNGIQIYLQYGPRTPRRTSRR